MDQVLKFVVEHPAFMVLVVWPLVTGVINFFLKPRTPEQYDEMHPGLRAVLKVTSGAGFDPVKTSRGLQEFITKEAASRHGAKQ